MAGRNGDSHYSDGNFREGPADLAAVQADDALLDMLGAGARVPEDADDELTRLITAWRREIHADSDRVLVDTNTALAVINAARRSTPRRNPVFGTVAAAAAVLVIGFAATGMVAKSAQPGDQLWGVTGMLYPEYVRSVEAAAVVREELAEAKTAIDQGKPDQARKSLLKIQKQLPVIAEAEGKTDLAARHQALEKQVESAGPLDTSPGTSPESGPSSGDPAVVAPTTSPTPTPTPADSSPAPSPTTSPTETPSPTTPAELTPPTPSRPQTPEPPKPPYTKTPSSNFSGYPPGYPPGYPAYPGPDWRPYPRPYPPGAPGSGGSSSSPSPGS